MPYGRGVGILLIRILVLENKVHENRNDVLLFYICVSRKLHAL